MYYYSADHAGHYCRLSAGVAASDGVVLRLRPDGRSEKSADWQCDQKSVSQYSRLAFGAATSITLTIVMGLLLLVYWRASRLLDKKVSEIDN
jgi:hypothetical protein